VVHTGAICSYLEGTNESSCDNILGIEHLYLHHLVKHHVRMLLEVVVQHLVCECVAEGWMRNASVALPTQVHSLASGCIPHPRMGC